MLRSTQLFLDMEETEVISVPIEVLRKGASQLILLHPMRSHLYYRVFIFIIRMERLDLRLRIAIVFIDTLLKLKL